MVGLHQHGFLVVEIIHQHNRLERNLSFGLLDALDQLVVGEMQGFRRRCDRRPPIRSVFADELKLIGRAVLGEYDPIAVVDHASESGVRHDPDAIPLGIIRILRALNHL